MRRSPLLAAALIAPLVATAIVAVAFGAPRSPIAYCRPMERLLHQAGLSHSAGEDDTTWPVLESISAEALEHAPEQLRTALNVLHDVAQRRSAGAAANSPEEARQAYQTVIEDFHARCPDTGEPPPPLAYCEPMDMFHRVVDDAGETFFPETWQQLAGHAEAALPHAPTQLRDDLTILQESAVHFGAGGDDASSPHPAAELQESYATVRDHDDQTCASVLGAVLFSEP